MRSRSLLFIGLTAVTLAGVALPDMAGAAQQRGRPAAHKALPRGLDLTTQGPSVAMRTAKEAQAGMLPGTTQAAGAAQPVEAPTSAPAGTVSGLTVTPEVQRQGKVVASTDATSLTSPNFSVADASDKSLTIPLGDNTAAGKQVLDNRPVNGSTVGVIRNNPDLLGSPPTRSDVGVTTVF
jgi:hypothetical protein